MNLKYITCSDPREFNDVRGIVNLAKISPRVEIAVQAHPSKMSLGMPRNEWFHELVEYIRRDKHDINLAIHVNREWCDEICRTGKIPSELMEFFYVHNGDKLLIKRWQLNVPKETIPNINVKSLGCLFENNNHHDFIIQYNANTQDMVSNLFWHSSADFSLLYDASGGRGISPKTWQEPVFPFIPQGYSGGLSPENIQQNLDKISSVVPANRDIWIDAEGKLKTDDKFDIVRARQYILNAENWITQNNKQR